MLISSDFRILIGLLWLTEFFSPKYMIKIGMQALSIKRINPDELLITWRDNHQSTFTVQQLRSICPCAACQGETVLFHEVAPQPKRDDPRQYELVDIRQVGSYAIQIKWADGHNAGIYTWEYLRMNCPCDQCSLVKKQKNN